MCRYIYTKLLMSLLLVNLKLEILLKLMILNQKIIIKSIKLHKYAFVNSDYVVHYINSIFQSLLKENNLD